MRPARPSAAPRLGHVATLDVLRFGAAAAVLVYHYLYRGAAPPPITATSFDGGEWVRHLYLAVHLFFAISGFVIMASVRDRDAVGFAAARFVRLWPAYAICAAVTLLIVHATGDPRFPASWAQWAANLTFVAPALGQPFADGAYWSIVVELVFYAWVAVMILLRVLPRHTLAFAATWLVLSTLNEAWWDAEALRRLAATRYAPWFVFGMVGHHLVVRGPSVAAWGLGAAAVALSMHHGVVEQAEIALGYAAQPDPTGIALANAAVLAVFALAVRFRAALRPRPWLLALGALTYPLYLLHQHIGYIALDALAPALGKHMGVALTAAGVLLLAWAVERFAERPARRALRRGVDAALAPVAQIRRRMA